MSQPNQTLLDAIDAAVNDLAPLKDLLPAMAHYLGAVCAESGVYTQDEAESRILRGFEEGWKAGAEGARPTAPAAASAPATEPPKEAG
jgi:hypothetical protein